MNTIRETWIRIVPAHRSHSRRCGNPRCAEGGLLFWKRRRAIWLDESWFCSSACFESALEPLVEQILAKDHHASCFSHRMPLGLLMLSRGSVGEEQLRTALSIQRQEQCDKIGQWLQRLGYVTERQVVGALALQWATPVLAFRATSVPQREIPSTLLDALRLVPVRLVAARRLLYLASSDPVDHTVLQAIETMTNWRTLPCVVSDRVMDELLCQTNSVEKENTAIFLKTNGPPEVSRIVSSYAGRLGAERVKLTSCGPYIWVRLNFEGKHSDLLFLRLAQSQREAPLRGTQGDQGERFRAYAAV